MMKEHSADWKYQKKDDWHFVASYRYMKHCRDPKEVFRNITDIFEESSECESIDDSSQCNIR